MERRQRKQGGHEMLKQLENVTLKQTFFVQKQVYLICIYHADKPRVKYG